MSKITKFAQGKECQIKLPVCNHNPETTVHAHFRMAGLCGMSMKPNDIFGAHACFECHDAVDRRRHKDLDYDFVRKEHMEAVIRTQALLLKAGLIRA